MKASGVSIAFSLVLASPVDAQTLGDALKSAAPGEGSAACRGEDARAVVVCGRRSDRYRIDPAVLQSSRLANSRRGKQSPGAQLAAEQREGQAPDRGRVDLTNVPKMPLEKAIVMALKGEDWREPLRQELDAYGEYQAVKRAEGRGGR